VLRAFLAIFLVLQLATPSAQSSELGARDDAVALVQRVQQKFKEDGPAATFKSINENAAEFRDRDLYVFAYNMKGVIVAHADNPALVGKSRINLKDQDGKFLVQEFVATVKKQRRGWIDYCWPNSVTVEDRSAYVERLDGDSLVGVSVFQQ